MSNPRWTHESTRESFVIQVIENNEIIWESMPLPQKEAVDFLVKDLGEYELRVMIIITVTKEIDLTEIKKLYEQRR